jgi:predicted Zn-dependent peptidase
MILNYKNNIDISTFVIVFDGSTQLETKGKYGTSHLIEHLLCKSFDHLLNDFQQYGITWNAYTSNNEIVFYLSGLDKFVNKYKYLILDLIINYVPSIYDFENEKKIIIEEYKDSFNEQINNHFLNLERKLFNYYSPIGLKEDIENYNYDTMINDINKYYRTPIKIINISKNSPFKNDMNLNIEYKVKKLKYGNFNVPLELDNDFKTKESLINFSPILNNKDDYPYIDFITKMLGTGLNSPLYQEIREKKTLVYYIHNYLYDINKDQYLITFVTETSKNNVNLFFDEISNILSNPDKYLTKERFNVIKKYLKINLEKNNILIHDKYHKFITPQYRLMDNIINKITFNKIREIYDKYFYWDDFYKSIYNKEF